MKKACNIQKKMHQVQIKLLDEIYKVKPIVTRLEEIEIESQSFRKRIIEFRGKVQSQLTWVEDNSTFPEYFPMKTTRDLKIEMALLEFCRKSFVRLNNEIEKTL